MGQASNREFHDMTMSVASFSRKVGYPLHLNYNPSKLNSFGITGELNSWFSSYLSERKQRVVLDGLTSSYGGLQAGVPQGSVLGPLLFLICINDIKNSLESTLSLYADDSLFFKFSNNIHTCNLALNRDLCRIDSWGRILVTIYGLPHRRFLEFPQIFTQLWFFSASAILVNFTMRKF